MSNKFRKVGYTVNEDGTVTRDRVPNTSNSSGGSNYSGNSTNNSGSDDNNGCWIIVLIAVIVGIIIAVSSANKNTSSSNDGYYGTDSCVVDSVATYEDYVVADTAVAEEYVPSSIPSNLEVSNSNISLSWEEQSYTINVYSSSSWWIDVNTNDWISLDCEGSQITMYVDSNPSEGARQDYFVIKNEEGLTTRVDIYQE